MWDIPAGSNEGLVGKGEKPTANVYEGQQNSLVKCMNTIYDGKRLTAASFLDGKDNITVLVKSSTKKLLLDADNVCFMTVVVSKMGKDSIVKARSEVIISCGVFESLKVLTLSGIGPKKQPEAFGSEGLVGSQNTGQNLLDQPILPQVQKL